MFDGSQWCVVIISIIVLFIVDYIKAKNKYNNINIKIRLFITYLLILSIVFFGKFGATTFIYLGF